MAETDTNPFVHPAQTRLLALIDQAEIELLEEQEDAPLHDPLERFHVAREWGVDPWVAAMLPVSQELTTLQNLAVGIAPDEDIARNALMSVVKHSLQALALFEEDQDGDQVLDDSQLADFLDRLVTQLDSRIDRLRAKVPTPIEVGPEFQEASRRHTDQVIADQKEPPADDHTNHVAFAPQPQTHVHSKDLIRAEEVSQDQTGHDFRPEGDPPPDLDAAERALARESAQLRLSAAGSSAAQVLGRHASPERTDPDVTKEGRH